MFSRSSLAAVWWTVLLFVASASGSAVAQSGDIFVTPVPNAQFSAVVQIERTVVRRGGGAATVFTLKSMRQISRDSRGRIHNERRDSIPVSSPETPQLLSIHLYDPQTRTSTQIDPRNQTFRKEILSHPPSTVRPTIRYASPTGTGLPQNEFTKEEDLGIQELEGVLAHGVRESQTIPAESSGTGREVIISDEFWYSDDLRINLLVKHVDPRKGAVTLKVTQITRTEPDPALFEIPEGYKESKDAGGN